MISVSLCPAVTGTKYERPSAWRHAGAIGKAHNIMELCRRHNLTPSNMLEVGAGDGAILSVLSEANFCQAMHALELSPSGVTVIQEQNIPHLEHCSTFDGYTTKYPDKYFDLVILSHVLEHVEYERTLLREIMRIGKHCIIEVPLDYSALEESFHVGPMLAGYGHINAYTPRLLQFLLYTEGLHIIDDILGIYNFEVKSYQHFEAKNKIKTEKEVDELYKNYCQEISNFRNLPRDKQEEKSSFYCVLARKMSEDDALKIHFEAAASFIEKNDKNSIEMVINSCKSETVRQKLILEIAKQYKKYGHPELASQYLLKMHEK